MGKSSVDWEPKLYVTSLDSPITAQFQVLMQGSVNATAALSLASAPNAPTIFTIINAMIPYWSAIAAKIALLTDRTGETLYELA